MGDRRGADAHVHFGGTGIADGRHELAAGGAADDGVVDHHHALAGEHIRQGVELHADAGFTHRLGGLNEGAAHVAVFDQTIAEGDAAVLRIANRRRDAGIRHADHNIGLYRRFAGEHFADTHAIAVERFAEETAIGPGEIDHLEHTQLGGFSDPAATAGLRVAEAELHQLAGLHVAVEAGADDVEPAGFAAHHPLSIAALAHVAKHQRPDAVPIAQGIETFRCADHQAERTAAAAGSLTNGGFPIEALIHRMLDREGDQLRVGGGGELHLGDIGSDRFTQFAGIHQIAVVGKGERAQPCVQQHRLGIAGLAATGGGVAVMADGQLAGQPLQHALIKHLAHQAHVLVHAHFGSRCLNGIGIKHRNARRLLAAVL